MPAPFSFRDRTLRIGPHEVELEHPIQDAVVFAGMVVVLLRPPIRKFGQIPNLLALDERGNRLWVAEAPTTTSGDQWEYLEAGEALVATSWSCLRCTLDPRTGRVVEAIFTK